MVDEIKNSSESALQKFVSQRKLIRGIINSTLHLPLFLGIKFKHCFIVTFNSFIPESLSEVFVGLSSFCRSFDVMYPNALVRS